MSSDLWGDEPDWFDSDNEDDDVLEEDDDNLHLNLGALHCLMLVDCGSTEVFEPCLKDPEFPEDPISPLDYLFQATEGMVRSKVKSTVMMKTGKRDAFGIILYNTRCRPPVVRGDGGADDSNESKRTRKEDQGEEDEEEEEDIIITDPASRSTTAHEFLPLQPPGIKTVKALRAVRDDVVMGREHDLQKQYGPTGDENAETNFDSDHPLAVALNKASAVFESSKYVRNKLASGQIPDLKQIWLFTTNADPCDGNEDVLNVLKTTVDDLRENVDIFVWPLPHGGESGQPEESITRFDYSLFYDKIGAITPFRDLENGAVQDADLLKTLLEDMQSRWKKTNRSFSLPLLLPDWKSNPDYPGIALDVYRLIQVAKKPGNLHVHQETGRLLTRVELRSTSTGEILSKKVGGNLTEGSVALEDRLRSYVEFGGERVAMTETDKTVLKKAANANSSFASLILVGFKEENSISIASTLDHAYFAYPNEDKTSGSVEAFAHLHKSMKEKGVLAIGELLPRISSTSRQVAIWPLQEREAGEKDEPSRPPGMMIVELAFEDEVREIGSDFATRARVEQGYELASPQLLDAFALLVDKLVLESIEVGTNFENADLSRFWDYVEHVALELPMPSQREVYEIMPNEDEVLTLVRDEKQLIESLLPADLNAEKKTKKRKLVADDSGIDWKSVYEEDALARCNNNDLKKKLRSIGEKIGGNKAEMINRLKPHLLAEFASDSKLVKDE